MLEAADRYYKFKYLHVLAMAICEDEWILTAKVPVDRAPHAEKKPKARAACSPSRAWDLLTHVEEMLQCKA